MADYSEEDDDEMYQFTAVSTASFGIWWFDWNRGVHNFYFYGVRLTILLMIIILLMGKTIG